MQLTQRQCFTAAALGQRTRGRRAAAPAARPAALFGWGSKDNEKEEEKEEQFRKQQEVLQRRRSNSWQAEVRERRAEVSRYMQDPAYKKQVDEEKRARFKARKEQEARENPEPKFGIIIPLAPFGMADYDGGERFDLRLPYVDQGDPDQELANDPLGLKQLGRAFGIGKKKGGDGGDAAQGKRKGASARPLPLRLAAAAPASRRALKAGYGSEFLTSQGDCLSAVSSVPSDVPIDGIDCGTSSDSGSGTGGAAGCPADTAGPSSLVFMQATMSKAVSSKDATFVAQSTALAAAQLLAQFYANGEACLARAPAFFAQLGQAVQQDAASGCRDSSAGDDLAAAVAGAAQVMWDAVSPRLSCLASVEEAVQLAAQAALPSLTKGFQSLVQQCNA